MAVSSTALLQPDSYTVDRFMFYFSKSCNELGSNPIQSHKSIVTKLFN